MPDTEVDVHLLTEMIRRRRKTEDLSLRDAAEQIGVSAPTLQRVEAGQIPNTSSLIRIADWLNVSLEDLRTKAKSRHPRIDTVAQIEVHLRADPHLDDQAAEAIAEAVQKLYEAFSKQRRER